MSARVRGDYYVEAVRERIGADGLIRRYADQVGRQIRTRKEAFAILDRLNERGYVQQWSESQQRRFIVAERDTAGVWTSKDPFTGERVVLDVTA